MTVIAKKKIPSRIKEERSWGDWLLDIFKVLFLALVAIVTVYPFWNIFVVSIYPCRMNRWQRGRL